MSSGVLFIAAAVLVAKLVAPSRMFEQTSADGAAVRSAALDYVEVLNEGDSTKHVRSVGPDLFTYGFWLPGDSTRSRGEQMPRAELPLQAGSRRDARRGRPSPNSPNSTSQRSWRGARTPLSLVRRAEHSSGYRAFVQVR